MRHLRQGRKLGVKSKHRKALMRNLLRNLVIYKRIRTTVAKAKEMRSFVDRMIQIAKRNDLHARRLLIAETGCPQTADILLRQIAPLFKARQGGYTRVLKLGYSRKGDATEMALVEFTELIELPKKKEKKPKKVKEGAKAAKTEEAPVSEKKKKDEPKGKPETAPEEKRMPTEKSRRRRAAFWGNSGSF